MTTEQVWNICDFEADFFARITRFGAVLNGLNQAVEEHMSSRQSDLLAHDQAYVSVAVPKGKKVSKLERYGWTLSDEPGRLEMIDKRLLQVDQQYQRDLDHRRVSEIASAWSYIACGTITVACRHDGTLFIMEGQHRHAAALRRVDIEAVPCIIFNVIDVKEEAAGFLRANVHRRPVAVRERFRSLVATENEPALLVKDLLDKTEYKVSDNNSSKNNVACIGSLLKIAADYPTLLRRYWDFVVECHGGDSFHDRVLQSTFHLARMSDGAILREPYRSRIQRMGRQGILDAAHKASVFYSHGGYKVWSKGLLEEVNRGLRANKLTVSALDKD